MNELSAFERRLAAGLEAYAGPRQSVDADAIARAAASPLPLRRSILLRFVAVVAPAPRLAWRPAAVVALVAILALALAASVLIVGNQQPRLPALVEPAGNGLIAYSSGGDIYIGDPATGDTTAIATAPEIDSGPIFSPDGTRIAFIRGNPLTEEASLVVVRVDGSDEQVVMPPGYSDRGTAFAWTPDGASLLGNVDTGGHSTPYFDGELALFDASGVAEPRLLTPPLPIFPGGPYFRYTAQVAPMFRPPNGDLILSHGTDATFPTSVGGRGIYVWDADLESHTLLEPAALKEFAPYSVPPMRLWWSPDGSRIAFTVAGPNQQVDGFYVMNADGSGVRRLEAVGSPLAWSPDGTKLAFERCRTSPAGDGTVIVIVDVATGAERVLESTSVRTKTEGAVPTPPLEVAGQPTCGSYAGPEGRNWDFEGWSWSPDGRSIVLLERSGTRPMVVDVETGQATDLPVSPDREGREEAVDVGDDGMILTRFRGGAWHQTVRMSDPRLEGAVYHTYESDTYTGPGTDESPLVWAATFRIENEAGAWVSRGVGGSYSDGTPIGNPTEVLIGEGAYEGMIAIMDSSPLEHACGNDVRGVLFGDGPVPEPYIPR